MSRTWGQRRLKYAAEILAGQSPPSERVEPLGSDLPFLQGNAEFGQRSPTARFQCRTAPKRCRPGDILISVRAPVGAMNWADRAYGIGRGLMAVRPLPGTDVRFLWWLIDALLIPGMTRSYNNGLIDQLTR